MSRLREEHRARKSAWRVDAMTPRELPRTSFWLLVAFYTRGALTNRGGVQQLHPGRFELECRHLANPWICGVVI